MFPPDRLWPPNEFWSYHAGGGQFKTIDLFTRALDARYGAARNLDDFAQKSQLMAYEGERAMFEGFARNKYRSTGVIQWMLNNAWPSLIWHLYDYYLRPGGGYFGAKKGAAPLHALYGYDDRAIWVANHGAPVRGLTLRVRLLDLTSATQWARDTVLDLPADSSVRVLAVPEFPGPSSTYFLDLRLLAAGGGVLSNNFYWLSRTPDDLDFGKSTWYVTPARSYADFTGLATLPATQVSARVRFEQEGPDEVAHVTLSNPGSTVAFFLRLQVVTTPGAEEILPVLWHDNYLSLLPGESREVTARYRPAGGGDGRRALVVSGWNVARMEQP
jgi:exo-1,4-beta-D-glucosaminidase